MRIPRAAWILVTTAVALALVVAFFDWNWLRGPIARYVGGKLDREVVIRGPLQGEFSLNPLITGDDVTIANAPWGSQPQMATADRVAIRVDLVSLLRKPARFLEITLTRPRLLLERSRDGQENWAFGDAEKNPPPQIGRLSVDSGQVRFFDPAPDTGLTLDISSAAADGAGELPTRFKGTGKLQGHAFTLEGHAAQVLALGQVEQPFRISVSGTAGTTRASFNGSVVPARIDNVDGAMTLQGHDLSQLQELLPIRVPWTPPYTLKGTLAHDAGVWSFRDVSGKVGDSDLSGRFDVDGRNPRRGIVADIVSEHLRHKDLGGFIGLSPPSEAPATPQNTALRKDAARRAQSGRMIAGKPFNLVGLRRLDARVHLRAKRFTAPWAPLDSLDMVLILKDGVMRFKPFDFGLGGGHVTGNVTMDASQDLIQWSGEVTARNVELKEVVPALKPPGGSAGKVGGHGYFTAAGNTMADMMAGVNGELALISRGGMASELSVLLTNLDLANAAKSLLKGDEKTSIRCVVADFAAEKGVMTARSLVADTDSEKIVGTGRVDFANERYDLTLKADSKKASLFALRGPILIDGSFRRPNVHPAAGPLAGRVGASAALALVNPLAALLPLIDYGGAKDADCGGLIERAKDNVDSHEVAVAPATTRAQAEGGRQAKSPTAARAYAPAKSQPADRAQAQAQAPVERVTQ